LAADLFLKQLERIRLDLTALYTNHVAAAMHRYWGAAFPLNYTPSLDREWIGQYAGESTFAMDKFNRVLAGFVEFVDANPEYTMLIGSSMGAGRDSRRKDFRIPDDVTITRNRRPV
jgi:hypothetical protein